LHHSVRFAKRYVQGALEASAGANVGQGGSKPMNFAYSRFDWQSKADLKRFDDLRLCAITDESLDRKHGRSVRESVAAAIKGGATVVQVRWKSGETVDCVAAVNQALEAARGSGVPIVVNDRVDVALTCQADGVHVGQEDVVASDVRRLIGPSMLLGVSAKTEEQIATAGRAGADYVGCGAVFGSPTKPESGKLGTDRLHKLASVSPIPVMGIGGVDASNVGQMVTEAGVDSAAVISGIFDTPAPASAAHSVRTALESAINGSTDEVEA
jgi:hydroxymethylpyrimidine kinase/phosphomethylpyrimidine kinase/thiamine-phosphate diphosphorylase